MALPLRIALVLVALLASSAGAQGETQILFRLVE
jgi:hypothetical protein